MVPREVRKLALSINYIHKASIIFMKLTGKISKVSIKNEPHRINCVNSFINLV